MPCDLCGGPGKKVIYMGFPMRICDTHNIEGEEAAFGWGFWSWVPVAFGFNGWFYAYTGSYWLALWRWLKDP